MKYTRPQIWIMAARPKTLAAAIAPVLIGWALAYEANGFNLYFAMAAMFGAIFIQIGTNFANDYFDFKKGTDNEDRLGPLRVTQAKLVKPEIMLAATIFLFIAALLIGIYLVYRGGWPIVIIGSLSILFGIMYTAGPYPLGYNGLGEIFVLLFFGPVATAGTYYVQTLTVTPVSILAGLSPGLFSVAILAVNNLRDIDSDRKSGKRTLAVRLGIRFAIAEYRLAMITASLIALPLALILHQKPYASIATLAILPTIPLFNAIAIKKGKNLNEVLGKTGMVLIIYSILFSIGWNL